MGGYLIYANLFAGGKKFPIRGEAPDFALESITGEEVTLAGTNGKVRAFYFYFSYCPDVCPPTTYLLSGVQDLLKEKGYFGKDANLISITIDPERDTAERIKEFADRYKADYSGWLFLRQDDEAATHELAKKFQVGVMKDNEGNFIHANVFVLVDREGNIREFINANDPELTPEQVADDMIALIKE
jgi:protein SCO1/2